MGGHRPAGTPGLALQCPLQPLASVLRLRGQARLPVAAGVAVRVRVGVKVRVQILSYCSQLVPSPLFQGRDAEVGKGGVRFGVEWVRHAGQLHKKGEDRTGQGGAGFGGGPGVGAGQAGVGAEQALHRVQEVAPARWPGVFGAEKSPGVSGPFSAGRGGGTLDQPCGREERVFRRRSEPWRVLEEGGPGGSSGSRTAVGGAGTEVRSREGSRRTGRSRGGSIGDDRRAGTKRSRLPDGSVLVPASWRGGVPPGRG